MPVKSRFNMKVIDANNLIVGRMANQVAKLALAGEKVNIVNCEKAIITGSKTDILNKYKQRRERGGPYKGPFYPRTPDRLVRRIIRGMLPWKIARGREAFKRIMCYVGLPDSLANEKIETIEAANYSKLKTSKYLRIKLVSEMLGAKIQ